MDKTVWKAATLIALGLFLCTRLLNDVILFYINSRFNWLVIFGGIAMLLIGTSYAVLKLRSRSANAAHQHDEHCDHDHDHDHDHHHEHEHGSPVTWSGLLIALMPLLLGVVVPPQALGADALATRQLNLQSWHAGAVDVALRDNRHAGLLDGEKTIIEWLVEFSNTPRSELADAIDGEPVAVTGFVYHDERFGANQFMVTRYVVTCCVADAQPLGLIVEADGDLPPFDSWVAIEGYFDTITFDGQPSPAVVANDIRPMSEPRQPYIYVDG